MYFLVYVRGFVSTHLLYMARRKQIKSNKSRSSKSQQSLVPVPRGNLLPSSAKRVERTVLLLSGASVTNATGPGYSWFTIDSTSYSAASPWTALSSLYMFVRPLYTRVTVTACRATGTSDNPFVSFVPTPDGVAVGSTSINISTLEAPTSRKFSLGPGKDVSYTFKPHVAIAAYNTPTNGYLPMICPRLSINSLPRIYYGDILFATPGVNLVSTANYIQIKIEHVFEFDTIDNANIQ